MKHRSHVFRALGFAGVLSCAARASAEIIIEAIGVHQDDRVGVTLYAAKINAQDAGPLVLREAGNPLAQAFLVPAEKVTCATCGETHGIPQVANFDNDDDDLDDGDVDAPFKNGHPFIPRVLEWNLLAVSHDPEVLEAMVEFAIVNETDYSESIETVKWDLATTRQKPPLDRKFFKAWVETRRVRFYEHDEWAGNTPLADFLVEHSMRVYLDEKDPVFYTPTRWRSHARRREQGDDPMGSLAVFGGQAAVSETLQTQVLNPVQGETAEMEKPETSTAEMRGVEVKAHPFADMLTALDPGEPPATLADYAPADRLFVWVTDPRRLSQWLAPEVAGRFAPLLGGGFVDYGLLERYTGRFGMTLKEARTVLASGFISELALVAPDVFFRDNTDVTLVLRLNPAAMSFQFNRNVTLPVARRGDLLVLSTLQSELDAVLALIDAKGAESLGRSDEFRVMAAKLPVRDETKMFVYFSDPFIRRLTGPEVKIGQLRRATARARLEKFAARALLFRLDHGRDAEDTAELVRRHYAEEDEFPPDEFSLSPGCRAVSKTWGPLASLATLTAIPALTATPTEAAQYAAYRDRYTEFWRQYFDPVAVRLDATPQGGIALETFILPLIENSLYDGLKSVLGATPAEPLMVPEYDQPAIATLAFRIPGLPENLQSQMYGPARLFSPLLELAGTTVALSIRDTAPIVQVNFPGVSSFAGDSGFSDFLDPGMLVAAPFVASLFTRPCDIAIRVTDEARARAFLQGMRGFKSEFFEIETFYINDRETLILTWVLGGILRVELGLSVKDGWLHISNHPWTPANITGTRVENNAHAFIALTPSNLRAGLPQANALLRNKARESAADAAFSLKPWREAFHADAAAASGFQRAALGFATPVPSGVEDPPRGNRVETFDADAPLPAAIPDLRLHLGFEDDGLRSRVEFLPRNAAK